MARGKPGESPGSGPPHLSARVAGECLQSGAAAARPGCRERRSAAEGGASPETSMRGKGGDKEGSSHTGGRLPGAELSMALGSGSGAAGRSLLRQERSLCQPPGNRPR